MKKYEKIRMIELMMLRKLARERKIRIKRKEKWKGHKHYKNHLKSNVMIMTMIIRAH